MSGSFSAATILTALFRRAFGEEPSQLVPLSAHASARRRFRLFGAGRSVIGVWNGDQAENQTFIRFARHLRERGLAVPEIFQVADDADAYLEQDLGDETLFSFAMREGEEAAARWYEEALAQLVRFQVDIRPGFPLHESFARTAFDARWLGWIFHYFKYSFLKAAGIAFREDALEDNFDALGARLLSVPHDYLMYRDFQSRNVMLVREQPHARERLAFIDFQGLGVGPLAYDVASLLFQGSVNLSSARRAALLSTYTAELERRSLARPAEFLGQLPLFRLLRLLQTFGAYGQAGLIEGKRYFVDAIPRAAVNLQALVGEGVVSAYPELSRVADAIAEQWRSRPRSDGTSQLTVHVVSFSYSRGIPPDRHGHGGGFVFDCRALPNPGRESAFKHRTGRDADVGEFLGARPEVLAFRDHSQALVIQGVQNYLTRGFPSLTVMYGCTGGQHRSVWMAEQLAALLQARADVRVELQHQGLGG